MSRRVVGIASVVLALTLLARPAHAQTPGDSAAARDSAVGRVMAEFRVGAPIRVAMLRSRFRGEFMGVSGDTVFFGSAGQPPMAFRFNAVDSVWTVGRATRKGALGGAIVGAIAGAASQESSRPDRGTSLSQWLAGGAVGAAGGGLLGALIGSRFRTWKRLYP